MDGSAARFSEYVHTHRELFSAEALAVARSHHPSPSLSATCL